MYILNLVFFLIIRRPPTPTRPATLFPSTTLFRSLVVENHGQQSIERARGRNIFQLKRINEIGRLQADDAKGQSAGLFGAEIQNSGQIGRAHVELQSLMRISYAVFCLKKKTLLIKRKTTNIYKSTSQLYRLRS